MTRKETLLKQNYQLNNELSILNGNGSSVVDLETFCNTWDFRHEAQNETIYSLEQSNQRLADGIAQLKKEKAIKEATEAYFSTEAGKAEKEQLEAAIETKKQEFNDCETYYEDALNNWIADFLGSHWAVYYLCDRRLELAIKKEGSENEMVFGSKIEITYGKDHTYRNREWVEYEKFEFNVGAMGSADIQATETSSRARFYIDLGKFLADAEKTAELREMLFDYASTLEAIRTELNQLNDRLENPTIK